MPTPIKAPPPPASQRVIIDAPPLSDHERSAVQSIKALEEQARASISELNNIPKILAHAASDSPRVVVAALQAVCRCLSSSMESGILSSSSSTTNTAATTTSSSASETVRSWLRNLHSTFCKTLLSSLSSPHPFVQAAALRSIIGLAAREAESSYDKDSFSGGLFPRCIVALLDNATLADTTLQVLLKE